MWSSSVLAAAVTAGVGVLSYGLNAVYAGIRDARGRRREAASEAFAAAVAYAEFPYVVRRRRASDPEGERLRISEELRRVQERMNYYAAWMESVSPRTGAAYQRLVKETRRIAGGAIHQAWLAVPVGDDGDMNMPDLGLGELDAVRAEFLECLRQDMRPFRSALRRGVRLVGQAVASPF